MSTNLATNGERPQKVGGFRVFCVNKESGCKWKGDINTISKHLEGNCQFRDIPCPYCETLIRRQQLSHHVKHECVRRIVKCTYCYQFRGEFQHFQIHLMKCPYSPLTCPRGCSGDTILRRDLKAHEKVCGLVQVKCKFYKMGCAAVMARKDQESHNVLNLQNHLELVIRDRDFMASRIADVECELAEIRMANENLHYQLFKANQQIKDTYMNQGSVKFMMAQVFGIILIIFSVFAGVGALMILIEMTDRR